jgi:hypothetical protein
VLRRASAECGVQRQSRAQRTFARVAKAAHLLGVDLGQLRAASLAHGSICEARVSRSLEALAACKDSPPSLAGSGVRQLRHCAVLTANFISEPTVEVATWTLRVCAPLTAGSGSCQHDASLEPDNATHADPWRLRRRLAQRCASGASPAVRR